MYSSVPNEEGLVNMAHCQFVVCGRCCVPVCPAYRALFPKSPFVGIDEVVSDVVEHDDLDAKGMQVRLIMATLVSQ